MVTLYVSAHKQPNNKCNESKLTFASFFSIKTTFTASVYETRFPAQT